MSISCDQSRKSFSLVELLVVIGLLGVLLGLILPAVQQVRETAARSNCLNNLKQIGLALHDYHNVTGRFPPQPTQNLPKNDPNVMLGWMVLILPAMDQASLLSISEQACRIDPYPFHNPPHVGAGTIVKTYVCPSDGRFLVPLATQGGERETFTSFIGISGSAIGLRIVPGILGQIAGPRLSDITDGTSQTIMVGERPPPVTLEAGRWYSSRYSGPDLSMSIPALINPDDNCSAINFGPGRIGNPRDRCHIWSFHPGGANFLFADGSVHFLSYSAASILPALATRAGGEAISLPD